MADRARLRLARASVPAGRGLAPGGGGARPGGGRCTFVRRPRGRPHRCVSLRRLRPSRTTGPAARGRGWPRRSPIGPNGWDPLTPLLVRACGPPLPALVEIRQASTIRYVRRVPPMTSAGALLREGRQRAGLTQAQLAQRAGVTQSVISAYESGHRQPSIPTLLAILHAAGFALDASLIAANPATTTPLSGPLGQRLRQRQRQVNKDCRGSWRASSTCLRKRRARHRTNRLRHRPASGPPPGDGALRSGTSARRVGGRPRRTSRPRPGGWAQTRSAGERGCGAGCPVKTVLARSAARGT